jgi:hypothetical protein
MMTWEKGPGIMPLEHIMASIAEESIQASHVKPICKQLPDWFDEVVPADEILSHQQAQLHFLKLSMN